MQQTDRELVCAQCGQAFKFSSGEQDFYTANQLQAPKRCKACKTQYIPPDPRDVPQDFPRGDDGEMLPIYRGTGCRQCRQTSFRGRTGIHELLVTTDPIREQIVGRENASRIRHQALKEGMITLRRDGWRKVLNGTTTIDEVARVTAGDIIA